MSQRITLIMACIMAAACLAAVGLAWSAVHQSREVNAAILDKLTALVATPAEELRSPEWIPLKVKLVQGSPDGPPAEGWQVTLQGNLFGESGAHGLTRMLKRTTGRGGIADFGQVRAGQHSLNVVSGASNETLFQQITVRPGTDEFVEIVCPASPRPEVAIQLAVDWPQDLQDQGFWLDCGFATAPREFDGRRWFAQVAGVEFFGGGLSGTALPGGRLVVISPTGELFDLPPSTSYFNLKVAGDQLLDPSGKKLTAQTEVQWRGPRFSLVTLSVLDKVKDTEGRDSFEQVAYYSYNLPEELSQTTGFVGGFGGGGLGGGFGGGGFGGGFGGMRGGGFGGGGGGGGGGFFQVGNPFGSGGTNHQQTAPLFEAHPGEVNRWEITLPDELVEQVRQTLPTQEAEIDFHIDWPDDLQDEPSIKTSLIFEYRKSQSANWETRKSGDRKRILYLVDVHPDGHIGDRGRVGQPGKRPKGPKEAVDHVVWAAGAYRLVEIDVLWADDAKPSTGSNVLAQQFYVAADDKRLLTHAHSSPIEHAPQFTAEAESPNRWAIPLPERIIEQVRQKLQLPGQDEDETME